MFLNLPLYKQPKDSGYCMPYSIKALIEYFTGERFTKKYCIRKCKCTQHGGAFLEDGVFLLENHNITLEPIEVKDIKKAIRRKNPVLVCFQDSVDGESHFTTIIGIKKLYGIDTVFFNDTYYGRDFTLPLNLLELLMSRDRPQNWLMEAKYSKK